MTQATLSCQPYTLEENARSLSSKRKTLWALLCLAISLCCGP